MNIFAWKVDRVDIILTIVVEVFFDRSSFTLFEKEDPQQQCAVWQCGGQLSVDLQGGRSAHEESHAWGSDGGRLHCSDGWFEFGWVVAAEVVLRRIVDEDDVFWTMGKLVVYTLKIRG